MNHDLSWRSCCSILIMIYHGVRVARSLFFCVVFCRSLFVIFHLFIVLSVLYRFMDSVYPVGTFKLLLLIWKKYP